MTDETPESGLVESGQPAPTPSTPRADQEVELKSRSCVGAMLALAGVAFGALYLTNLGAGFVEFLPDNIPLFGNLDEAGATTLLVLGLVTPQEGFSGFSNPASSTAAWASSMRDQEKADSKVSTATPRSSSQSLREGVANRSRRQ